ncbi:MAG: ATP-grasp domain-containing protein [Vicinamibacterales bacterium]
MTSPRRVLVLDGHSNQALATVRSLGRAGHTVFVAAAHRRALASWSRFSRGSVVVSRSLDGMRRLRRWARERDIDVVLPMSEPGCILLNEHRDAWAADGVTLGCAPQATLQRAFDKTATLTIARDVGVAAPEWSVPVDAGEAATTARRWGWRLVVKATRSHAWNGTEFLPDAGCAYVGSEPELEPAIAPRRQGSQWPLLQRYVPGVGRGVFTVWHEGRPLAWFAHERLRDVRPTGSGSSLRRAARLDPRLRAPAERLLRALRWHGPAMVEFRDDGTTPWLMEINGRFWNSLQLSVDAGVDFPVLWLDALGGQSVDGVSDAYRTDVVLRWLWGDVKRLLYIAAGRPPGFTGPFPTLRDGLRELVGRQPAGTRLETWRSDDRWPAVGEWVQGIQELLSRPVGQGSAAGGSGPGRSSARAAGR